MRAWSVLTIACLVLTANSASGEVTYLHAIAIPPSNIPFLAMTYPPVNTGDPGYSSEVDDQVFLVAADDSIGRALGIPIDTATGAPGPLLHFPTAILVDSSSIFALSDRGGAPKVHSYTLTAQLYTYNLGSGSLLPDSPFIDSLIEIFSMAATASSGLTAMGIGLDGPSSSLGWSIDTQTGAAVPVFGLDGNASGDEPGQFNNARYHTHGPNGLCYVLDYGNHRVQILDPENGYAYVSEFSLPPGVPNMQFAIGVDGDIYLGDGAGGGFAYDSTGNYKGAFPLPPGTYPDPFLGGIKPSVVAASDGNLFVFDTTGAHQYSTADVLNSAPSFELMGMTSYSEGVVGNGGFDSLLANWTYSGNLGVTSPPNPRLGFNGGNSAPNGSVSQSFTTVPGQGYLLTFDCSLSNSGGSAQSLQVEVSNSDLGIQFCNAPASPYFTFTATGTSSLITFTDVATNDTVSQDILLDNVRIDRLADSSLVVGESAQTLMNFASSISPGPIADAGQAVSFLVTTNNAALFSVPPAIDSNGTLTFTPAGVGSAYVSVAAQDDGGLPGIYQSQPLSFRVVVDPPPPTATPTNTPTATPTQTPTQTPTPTSAVAACPSSPRLDCVVASKGSLTISNKPEDAAKRKLSWSWSKGSAELDDFGNPSTGTTNYRLCVYDDSALAIDAEIAAGGTCGSKPCWKSSDTAHKYTIKGGNADGIASVKLKSGVGNAAIQVKAKGANLANPFPLADTSAVTVQLVRNPGAAVECWGSTFPSPARKLDANSFKDKIPD